MRNTAIAAQLWNTVPWISAEEVATRSGLSRQNALRIWYQEQAKKEKHWYGSVSYNTREELKELRAGKKA